MRVGCPYCKKEYEVDDCEKGRKAECSCGHKFILTPIRVIHKNPDYVFHCSAKNYFWDFFLGGILTLTVILAIVGIPLIIYRIIQIKTTKYTITSDKLISETGLFNKRKTSIFLADIRNVDLSSGLWQRFLKIGYIRVSTAGNAGYEITMEGVADPEKILQMLNAGHK